MTAGEPPAARSDAQRGEAGPDSAAEVETERLRAFHARNRQYLSFGLDRVAAARFVAGAASGLRGRVLDVGTGKGLFAVELARRGLEVVSVDVDDTDRELARLLAAEAGVGGRVSFVAGDAARLDYPAGCFDGVVMMDVLHHLAQPRPVLHEMVRVLADGGPLVVADFDEAGFAVVSAVHRQEGHEHPRSTASLSLAITELAEAGCRCLLRTNGCLHDVAVLQKQPGRRPPAAGNANARSPR